jgi:uncharacterized membrane protein YgcG
MGLRIVKIMEGETEFAGLMDSVLEEMLPPAFRAGDLFESPEAAAQDFVRFCNDRAGGRQPDQLVAPALARVLSEWERDVAVREEQTA